MTRAHLVKNASTEKEGSWPSLSESIRRDIELWTG